MEETQEEREIREAQEAKEAEDLKIAEESAAKETSEVVEGDLNQNEVDEMLADGTLADKKITVKKKQYDEKNEKSQIYDKVAPLLAKLAENPDLVDRLIGGKETLERRVERIEQQEKDKKITETREVLAHAIKIFPDFKEKWADIRPLVDGLEKQGIPYDVAVQRAYFSVNPDAIAQKERLVKKVEAQEKENGKGTFSSSPGVIKITHQEEEIDMPAGDIEFAKKVGIPLDLYKKHGSEAMRKYKHL